MEGKYYIREMICYQKATEKQKSGIPLDAFYDLELLPTKGLQTEFFEFLKNRSETASPTTIYFGVV